MISRVATEVPIPDRGTSAWRLHWRGAPGAHALVTGVLLLLMGCAPVGAPKSTERSAERSRPSPAAHGEMPIWRFHDLAEANQPLILLRSPAGFSLAFESARAKLIHAVALKIVAVAGKGEAPDWLLVGTPSINAFATYQNGQPVIAVTLGMVNLLKDDEGAWAALIGHELAHFRLGHHQARRSRQEAVELGSSLAGLVLSAAGLGIGSVAADATGTLVERSFSRDDECDADRAGLGYARLAGFDPQGAMRLQERLLSVSRESAFAFLSTHPSGRDRVETIRRLLEELPQSGRETPATQDLVK